MEQSKIRKSALVMCLSDPSGDPRPNRILMLLDEMSFRVDVLSHISNGVLPVRYYFPVHRRKSFFGKVLNRFYFMLSHGLTLFSGGHFLKDKLNDLCHHLLEYRHQLLHEKYDVIVVEDLQLLPLAFRVKGQAKVVFDAREYYPRQNEDDWRFNIFEKPERIRLCRYYLSLCDQVITVSPGLAVEYSSEFGISAAVIRSIPGYCEIVPSSSDSRRIRLVHHGAANRNRCLVNMIEVVRRLNACFVLDFYLVGDPVYIQELKEYAVNDDRIRFLEPVLFSAIISTLNKYDIGFFYVEPSTFNLKHCLPNKLFEYIQARLMLAIGPSPDMADIVRSFDCGIISEEFSIDAMVESLNAISSEEVDRYKRNSDIAAKELSYENEQKKLGKIIEGLFV